MRPELKRHQRRNMNTPEGDEKCTGFFCKYGTTQDVNADSTNVTEWLDTSAQAPHHHKGKTSHISNNNAPGKDFFGTSNGNANSKNAPNAYVDGTHAPLILGCLIISVGTYYFTRAALRRRLFSRMSRKLMKDTLNASASEATCTCTGTVIKKECKNIWEFRATDMDWLDLHSGIMPVAEVHQPWPVAPFNLFVCYEAPMGAIATSATADASPLPAGQGTEFTIKKLENVSKKRFMNTTPGDMVKLVCLEGKPRSGMIFDEVQYSSSLALEEMVLLLFLILIGVGFCAWAFSYPSDAVFVFVPLLVATFCFLISFKVHRAQCHVLEEKLIDGKHNTSETLFTTAMGESAGIDGDTPEPNESNVSGEIV